MFFFFFPRRLKIKRGLHKIGNGTMDRVVCYPDNRVEHWLNGYKVVEFQRGNAIYQRLWQEVICEVENLAWLEKGRITFYKIMAQRFIQEH